MDRADGRPEDDGKGLIRRDFLTVMGSSFAAISLAGGCSRRPEEKIVPHLVQPEESVPGVALWYASTCPGCPAGCGALVKTRESRPVKLEGNPQHPLSLGGLCARGQASVLDLYDSERFRGPRAGGRDVSWPEMDGIVGREIESIRSKGGAVRLVSRTIHSPSLAAAVESFLVGFPDARHVLYDPLSCSAILEAHRITHGERRLPWYRFEKAQVVVGIDADFLGTWISPVEFTRGWVRGRIPGGKTPSMSWHAQFEARMSVTGASADLRVPVAPSGQRALVAELIRRVRGEGSEAAPGIEEAAVRLKAAPGRSLVVSGSRDLQVQVEVNRLNHLLGNYGGTVDLLRPSLQARGDDASMNALIDEMKEGKVAALVVLDANPAYEHPRAAEFVEALGKVGLTVSLAGRRDETAARVRFVCPDHHPLEAWGDAHPHVGVYSLVQPVLAPLHGTRAAVETLLTWAGHRVGAHDFLRKVWREKLFPMQKQYAAFEDFWIASLHDGTASFESEFLEDLPYRVPEEIEAPAPAGEEMLDLDLFASPVLGDGRQANNPWLQELPDPITKVTWGNVASLSPASAEKLGVVEGRVVEITDGTRTVHLPAQIQPGMADGVVAVALGYGRTEAGEIAANYPIEKMFPVEKDPPGGADLYPFLDSPFVRIRPTGGISALAKTQTYDRLEVPFLGERRPWVHETTLGEFQANPRAGNPEAHAAPGLWPEHAYPGHKWGMVIDLNACTGCSACVVGCQAENNIPSVGKAEVRKAREMHWLRIDRYYGGPDDRPEVSFQPMLCQHCDNAPCETVCPVLATLHSSEGLNMQVYNRCVGTRYCANNCPYKVRRFNWFDYGHEQALQNLVLNPDVTVRTRGVMEKCTFCVQRISEAKAHARGEGRDVKDGEIQPACAQSCPAGAIIFGDLNDARSRAAKAAASPRAYAVVAEVGTRPSVRYLTRVRNRKSSTGG